ncbi:MAG TPA: hypothetical protein GX522_03130 [Firmicutes bacterium]|nr:hypothetical protein [Bacillota bacterium]
MKKDFIKNIPWPLVGLGLLGLILLFWGSIPTKAPKTEVELQRPQKGEEEKLSELLSTLGLGQFKVMLTYEDGGRLYLATDEKIEREYDKGQLKSIKEDRQVVRLRKDSGESGYILHEKVPSVSGVVLTCSRKLSSAQKLMVIEAVRALWDLPLGRIVILGKE